MFLSLLDYYRYLYHMSTEISTTKEKEVIWEENESTIHQKKSEPQSMNAECDTTISTNDSKESGHLTDTISIKCGIYKIVNKINGKYYVGSAHNFIKRWKGHKKLLKADNHPNIHLQRAWQKYGESIFEFVIVEPVYDIKELLSVEQKYLNNCKTNPDSNYNVSYDATCPMYGRKHSNETKQKMIRSRTGKKMPTRTMEWRKSQSQIMKDKYKNGFIHPLQGKSHLKGIENPMYGKRHSAETIRKISTALTGKHPSQETREKLGKVHRDISIFSLKNNKTNEIFNGTKHEFIVKYNNGLRNTRIYRMFKGIWSYKGWNVNKADVSL